MTTSHEPSSPTIVAPQMLLGNHLKVLKLPTFAREYREGGDGVGAGSR